MHNHNITNRTVAFLDILGFRKLLNENPLSKLADQYEKMVLLSDALNKPLMPMSEGEPSLFPNHKPTDIWCNKYIFSDSIILVSTGNDSTSCLKLLVYARRLLQFLLSMHFPVRGGIAYGELYENSSANIVIGRSLTDAYELETKQQWIGAAISETVENAFPNFINSVKDNNNLLNSIFLRYPVPFKKGLSKELHTLNWRFNFIVKKGTRSLFEESCSVDVKEKVKNTLDYAKAIVESGRIYSKDEEKMPVELRAFFVGDTEPPFSHGDDL